MCSKRKTRQDDARQIQQSKERMQSKENKGRRDNVGKAKNNIDKPEQQRKVKKNNKR